MEEEGEVVCESERRDRTEHEKMGENENDKVRIRATTRHASGVCLYPARATGWANHVFLNLQACSLYHTARSGAVVE